MINKVQNCEDQKATLASSTNEPIENSAPKPTWHLQKAENNLNKAFKEDSEMQLLAVLKKNSFLFHELYSRKFGIQPVFHEVEFGNTYRCDFVWLNDNSDGPEWTIVELEKPNMRLFNADGKPSKALNDSIEQIKTWQRYFSEYPAEKKRIFGAVAKFRFILVAGNKADWSTEAAAKWRIYHNSNSTIELRTTNVFHKSLELIKKAPESFWSFEEHPESLAYSYLKSYWAEYGYMDFWRKALQ